MARNFIVLDTEGYSSVKHTDGRCHADTALFYDFGFIVANGKGEVLAKYSFVNTDTFFQTDKMASAYYANKLPQYHAGIKTGEWTLANTREIMDTLHAVIAEFGVRDVWAYNANYDEQSTNYTVQTASNGFVRELLPAGCRWRDIWDYASNITGTAKFVKWCFANGYTSAKGNPSTSADTVTKYVKRDLTFCERHTALSDCECELEILLAAKRRHAKTRHASKGQGWRDASKKAKALQQ